MNEAPRIRTHVLVLVALLLLTGSSWGMSQVLGQGWDLGVALLIALVKILLVAMIFMDLRGRPLRSALALIIVSLLGAVLIGLIVGDVVARPLPSPDAGAAVAP